MMIDGTKARYYGWSVVFASWLAVFCLFGYRATFAILNGPMAITLGWTAAEVTLGYSLIMVFYAVAAFFSGMMLDKWGTKPVYAVAAGFGCLGFMLTARADTHMAYLFAFGLLGGTATGMLWVASTVSVRKWFIGKSYATMWRFAFAGGPMAQFVLSQLVKPSLSASQAKLDMASALWWKIMAHWIPSSWPWPSPPNSRTPPSWPGPTSGMPFFRPSIAVTVQ
jgi:MFS family permease